MTARPAPTSQTFLRGGVSGVLGTPNGAGPDPLCLSLHPQQLCLGRSHRTRNACEETQRAPSAHWATQRPPRGAHQGHGDSRCDTGGDAEPAPPPRTPQGRCRPSSSPPLAAFPLSLSGRARRGAAAPRPLPGAGTPLPSAGRAPLTPPAAAAAGCHRQRTLPGALRRRHPRGGARRGWGSGPPQAQPGPGPSRPPPPALSGAGARLPASPGGAAPAGRHFVAA